MIRTLWSNEQRNAGTYSLANVWDGKDDNGSYVADENYTIKVVSSNATYEWLQPIGNTSLATSGSPVHRWFQMMTNMVQVGSDMYFATGYNESADAHGKFAVSQPNVNTTTLHGGGQFMRFLATDGNIVYSAGQRDQVSTFITGIVPAGVPANPNGVETLASFSSGTPYSLPTGSLFIYSAFGITTNSDFITGLGVMRSGNYLVSTQKTLNRINVFNKTTGAVVQTITSISNPREIAISGTDLWVISGTNTVAKYTINSNGTISSATLTLSGLTDPLSVAVSPDGSKVAVADRGTYNQVKFFNTSTGSLISTVGRAETYANPTVYNDKFYFNNTRIFRENDYGTSHAFVTFQSDGSYWVGDYGNMRCQHFAADNTYLNQIQYMGYSYSTQADVNVPTRVFSDFLEFAVNYTDNSWTFIKNWSKNITLPTGYDSGRMRSVATLSNGRTYALYNNVSGREIIELDNTTGIRHTGVYTDNYNCDLNPDGSQWQIGNNNVGSPTFWKRKALTGFDSNNNPQWGSYVTVETTPNVSDSDPLTADGYLKRNQQSLTGVVASFSSDTPKVPANTRGRGYHLGGVKNGQWVFRVSPSTRSDYIGDFPADGAYDIGNDVNNAGSFVEVVDRNIFWGYIGENWKGSQTNIYNHYLDNGLMVGQFGVSSGFLTRYVGSTLTPVAGEAGNANAGTYVKVGSDIHFFHADEGSHSAVHHWKISNLSSIQEYSVSVVKAGIPILPATGYVDLMSGIPVSVSLITTATGRWSFSPTPFINDVYDRWQVRAGSSTYKSAERSLRFTSYPATNNLTREAYCDLALTSGVTNSLTTWRITAQLTYPEAGENFDNFIDVLDNTGKVIVRISRPDSFPTISVKANTTTIVSGSLGNLFSVSQPLSIRRSGTGIIVSYADYPEVTVTAFDPTANSSSPTTLRIHLYSANTAGHQMDLANLKLYTKGEVIQVVSPCNEMVTIRSGAWHDPTTWSGSRVPGGADNVTIAASHMVTVGTSLIAVCYSLKQAGRLMLSTGSKFRILSTE